MDDEIKILDNLECCFCDRECCVYVSVSYNTLSSDYDPPYHLRVKLFGDFFKEGWYEDKTELISELADIDDRFDYCGILDSSLEEIEEFKEPSTRSEEDD